MSAPSSRTSIRTPLSRVRGLGAAHGGTVDFWRERVTGLALIPLTIGLVVILALVLGRPYPEAMAVLAHPLSALVLLATIIMSAWHMRIGMQVIIEDYVHVEGLKVLSIIASNFFCFVVGLAGVYAILRIALARLV